MVKSYIIFIKLYLLPTYFYLYLIKRSYEKLYINYIYSNNNSGICCNIS